MRGRHPCGRRPRSHWTLVLLLGATLMGAAGPLLVPAPLAGQVPARVIWEPRPLGSGVAVSVRFPQGAHSDPVGSEGTAFLFGRSLEAEGTRLLAPMSARVHVDVERESLSVTLFAPSGEWLAAWREIAGLLSGSPLSGEGVQAARDRLLDELLFQAGAPVRAFERAWDAERLAGLPENPAGAGHPVGGSVQGVAGVTPSTLEGWRSRNLRWEDAVVAVVGPVSEAEAGSLGGRMEGVFMMPDRPAVPAAQETPPIPAGTDPAAAGASPTDPLPPLPLQLSAPSQPLGLPSGGLRQPLGAGIRRVIDEEITSTWIGVAWALPRGTPWVLRDFLSLVVADALNPSPPDPGLYRADVHLEHAGETPLLVVVATVDPQSAAEWEARILSTLAGVATEPPPGAFFELARRRYRSSRMLEGSDPGLRARWLAVRASLDGRVPDLASESWGLSREGLAALARARGEPRILVYGPVRMMTPP